MKAAGHGRYSGAVLAGLLAAAVLIASGCGKKTSASGVNAIRKAGKLVAAVRTTDNPLFVQNGESYSGTEAELVGQIASQLNVTAEYVPADSAEAAADILAQGKADIALGMIPAARTFKPEPARSQAYAQGPLFVLTRAGDYSDSPAAFKGRKLGIGPELADEASSFAAKDSGISLVTLDGNADAAAALTAGTVDGYVCRKGEGLRLLAGPEKLQMQNLLNTKAEQYVILTKAENKSLIGGINALIERMRQSAVQSGSSAVETNGGS